MEREGVWEEEVGARVNCQRHLEQAANCRRPGTEMAKGMRHRYRRPGPSD